MIKVFTLNENGKIEITKEELENLLNESYWDGYYASQWHGTECPEYVPTITCSSLTVNSEDKNNV